MIKEYKIIATIFAGRKDRMQILIEYIKYLIDLNLIDELHIWNFARQSEDFMWVLSIDDYKNKIKIMNAKDTKWGAWTEYYNYYADYKEVEKTVLIKIDDDIVYLDVDKFKYFIDFRITNQDYFIVLPNIINNGICANIMQSINILNKDVTNGEKLEYDCTSSLWKNGKYAEQIHIDFIKNINYYKLYVNKYIDCILEQGKRISINFFSILGKDLKHCKYFGKDDEQDIADITKKLNRNNCIYLPFIVSHLSYFTQDKDMNINLLLNKYKELQLNSIKY